MKLILQKLASRKFLVTVGAILLVAYGGAELNLEEAEVIVAGVVSAVFVACEAVIDRQRIRSGYEGRDAGG